MLKVVRKHPVLMTCAVVALACIGVMLFYSALAVWAWRILGVTGFVATLVLSYRVYGAPANSSIYRPDHDGR